MNNWEVQSNYYSGQGVVLVGDRDAQGNAKGLRPVGNVSDLKIQIATTILEHKDSQNGQRAIDLRLTTEIKGTLSMTMESFNGANLALALRADSTSYAATTSNAENVKLYNGAVVAAQRIKMSNLVAKIGTQVLTPFTAVGTPWDYNANTDAGSIEFNDGSVTPFDQLAVGGAVPTAITVGATTSITVANTASAGDFVALKGFAGADAALLNGKVFQIVTASPTAITVNANTTGKTITIGTPLAQFDGATVGLTYDYATQSEVHALTLPQPTKFLRFEGLNTADSNAPVIVEVFKFQTDPLKELALISDTVGQFQLEGSFLSDPLRTTGSKFFREMSLYQ